MVEQEKSRSDGRLRKVEIVKQGQISVGLPPSWVAEALDA